MSRTTMSKGAWSFQIPAYRIEKKTDMHYTGQIYRPPSEAWTPLLEVTYGCSHNTCAFCTMYKDMRFGAAKMADIESDLMELKSQWPYPIDRVYLTGGDPFALPTHKLLDIADLIHGQLDSVKTITCYASLYNLKNKSAEDLEKLHDAGYDEIYIGIETGYGPALDMIDKGVTEDEAFEQLQKLGRSGIHYIAILMLGIAGRGKGTENAMATARLLNVYPPKVIAMMTTSVQQGSELYRMREEGAFVEATVKEMFAEQITLLENLCLDEPENTVYSSYHVVNHVQVMNTLDKRDEIISEYRRALKALPDEILDKPNSRVAR